MLARIAVHSRGYSGPRPEITQTYVEMLNKGVTPVVCQKGSVGACGDLAPMSQIALLMLGAFATPVRATGVVWRTWNDGLAAASRSKLPVIVDVSLPSFFQDVDEIDIIIRPFWQIELREV